MRVNTSILKTYPAFPKTETVRVYFENKDVPVDSEALGIVRAIDSGATVTNKCDSIHAVEHLKSEARKVGGNAVIVTEYIKPSFWGSSCHQMVGTILRVYDFEAVPVSEPDDENVVSESETESEYTEVRTILPKPTMPRFRFSADAGYGWRTASLDGLYGDEKDYFQRMQSGFSYEGAFDYYFQDKMGISIVYSGYNSGTGDKYDLVGNTKLNYIGLDYAIRYSVFDKWLLGMKLGFGYTDYKITHKMESYSASEWGATLGGHISLGMDYMLSKNWGIGFGLSMFSGMVRIINFKTDGYKYQLIAVDQDNGVGLGQIRLVGGIRYFIP